MFNNIPPVTKNLLILNVLVYFITLFSLQSGSHLDSYLAGHYINSPLFQPYQIVTHMFSHSSTDFFHILFNMLLLVMFGGHLERVWGAKRYFIFYIACGIGAFLLYNTIGFSYIMELKEQLISMGNTEYNLEEIAMNGDFWGYLTSGDLNQADLFLEKLYKAGKISVETYNSPQELVDYLVYTNSSMVGASGAIFGLLAGFAILFPNTQLMLLFPPIPIKAKYLIGGYLAYEIYNSIYNTHDQIAHLAHVGGAVVGIIFVLVWRKFDKQNFY